MMKQQSKKNKTTCDSCSFNEDENDVVQILLQLSELIAQERDNRDSDRPLSSVGKRTRYEIGSSSSTPSCPSPLPGSHNCNGNTSATPPSSSPGKSDSNGNKMEYLLQNTIQVTENIRKLKQEISKTRQQFEMLSLTRSMLKRMEIEVSAYVKQKGITLNSSTETITGPEELPSQAPVQEEEKEGEDADRVLKQAEVEVECLASGSGTSVSCSSKETNEGKGLSDTSVKVTVLPDLNLSIESSSSAMDFVDQDDERKEAIAAHKWPL